MLGSDKAVSGDSDKTKPKGGAESSEHTAILPVLISTVPDGGEDL